jgi:uncharacterized protein (TIGR04255 family)
MPSLLAHRVPQRILECPIAEAIVEVRFESKVPEDVIVGLVYNALKESYPTVQQLPILQLPAAIRRADVNLASQPHHRLQGHETIVQVGPRMLSVATTGRYPGGQTFKAAVVDVFRRVEPLGIIDMVTRFGTRYVNIFQADVLPRMNLQLGLGDIDLRETSSFVRTSIATPGFNTLLQFGNDISVSDVKREGGRSFIDLDTTLVEADGEFFGQIPELIHRSHVTTKKLFFGMLRQDFIEELGPQYSKE